MILEGRRPRPRGLLKSLTERSCLRSPPRPYRSFARGTIRARGERSWSGNFSTGVEIHRPLGEMIEPTPIVHVVIERSVSALAGRDVQLLMTDGRLLRESGVRCRLVERMHRGSRREIQSRSPCPLEGHYRHTIADNRHVPTTAMVAIQRFDERSPYHRPPDAACEIQHRAVWNRHLSLVRVAHQPPIPARRAGPRFHKPFHSFGHPKSEPCR
jgi:hypothetical protein